MSASDEVSDPCLAPHPDCAIRLASAVHRFPCPEVKTGDLSYVKSFKTAGSHPTTQALTSRADEARYALAEALGKSSAKVSYQSIVSAAQNYNPLIHQVLLTCKVQPEAARLDARLIFEWASGMEKTSNDRKFFRSEALMYELVMTIACEGMGRAGRACENSTSGDFASASRELKQAAGIMAFLAEDQLPKWIARGSAIEEHELPAEASIGVCDSFKTLFLAIGQQMAVATVLVKPGVPNYKLLAKLSLGIAEYMELFVNSLRSEASIPMSRIDPNFFSLITFQVNLHHALSNYFLSRSAWAEMNYGTAISMMREATSYMRTRDSPTSKGMPKFDSRSSLKALKADVDNLRTHMGALLAAYEKDNKTVYFDKVPHTVPEDKKLECGLMMMKAEPYVLTEVEPAPLILPAGGASMAKPPTPGEDADRELARMLQEKLNAGEDV